jgi:hypothetical protein
MPQIALQPVNFVGTAQGSPIFLEVATFDESRKAKLRTYSRVQAFSDTSLIVGVYNPDFTISVAVPQDFSSGEDIETLLAGLEGQDQLFLDAEGMMRRVRVLNVSTSHSGGQPSYYTANITMKALDNTVTQPLVYPSINTKVVVTTSAGLNLTTNMPMIFFANGLFWVFYSGNADKCYYKTSSDGNTWSTTHLLSSSFTLGYGGGVLYYPHLNRFYYGFYQMDINIFYWRWGTPNANGTIAWGISEQNFATPYAYEFPTFDVDSTGLFWTATLYGAPFSGGIQDWAIWKNSALNLTVPQSGVDTSWNIGSPKLMVSKSNANNVCFFGKELATQSTLYYTTNGGTSWSNFNMPRVFNQTYADAVVVGNVVYIVYPQNSGGTGNVYFVTYNIGDGATSSEKLLGTIPVGSVSPGVSITTNQVNDLVVVWADQLSNIYRTLSHNLGAIWDAPKVMIAISGTIGALPVSVFDLTSYNQVLALAYLGPFNGAGFPLFAGGASFT